MGKEPRKEGEEGRRGGRGGRAREYKEGQGRRRKREEALIQVCVYVQKARGCVVPLEMV